MNCPYCGFIDTKVIESRCSEDGLRVRRRRECVSCSKRFTTYEIVEHVPFMVIKRDNSREIFDRRKVFNGIMKACEKRAVSVDEIESMVQNVESAIQNSLDREVPSSLIGDLSMQALREKDEVAYIRFASVYREFKDIHAFMDELKNFLDKN